ncbi:hypothetical protein V6N12_036586 [Hibiscus sabdariffa]|uniref:Pentatricopeptide repeat-containing protein n=1 Tax=Hibiscus sabdariffa TaxID=183260 RepID=A0ABR2ER34_9ROSI
MMMFLIDDVETVMADANEGNGADIKFSSLLYNALINGFCRMKRIDKAQAIKLFMTNNGCEEMQTKGFSPDEMTYKLIIGGLIREKKLSVEYHLTSRSQMLKWKYHAMGKLCHCLKSDWVLSEAASSKLLTYMACVGLILDEAFSNSSNTIIYLLPYC